MSKYNILFLLFCIFIAASSFLASAEEEQKDAEQQMEEFSIAGFGEQGKKTWQLNGKNADIYSSNIKLTDIVADMYGDQDDITLTADRGSFDKANGKMHLESNVVATTKSGAKMTTDSLDWDREKQLVTTPDRVNVYRENMHTQGTGAEGKTDLQTVTLQKDVKVEIEPKEGEKAQGTVTITCDGALEVDYGKEVAVFNENVKADDGENQIYSDRMDVHFSMSGEVDPKTGQKKGSIKKIVAEGNVKIVKGENESYAQKAEYIAEEKRVVLTGRPKLMILSEGGGLDASFGD
ncbi:MAG: LPS export ABC transporter periplasmic protein LptC [Candidatus Omnitrophica bacterium]|nr:LPS export ABC transporter periplasmic protein LptC [Candidatus Omnitrophota bacterium]